MDCQVKENLVLRYLGELEASANVLIQNAAEHTRIQGYLLTSSQEFSAAKPVAAVRAGPAATRDPRPLPDCCLFGRDIMPSVKNPSQLLGQGRSRRAILGPSQTATCPDGTLCLQ